MPLNFVNIDKDVVPSTRRPGIIGLGYSAPENGNLGDILCVERKDKRKEDIPKEGGMMDKKEKRKCSKVKVNKNAPFRG